MPEEYLDIVDENDKVVGRDTRENIYSKGLEHNVRVVNIFVFNFEGKLLLPKKTMGSKYFPGRFDFSCGEHVVSGEDYDQAAKRGIEEELGIKDAELIELGKLTPKDDVSCFMKVYELEYNKEIVNYDRAGIDKLYWCDLKKVRQMVSEDKNKFKGDFPEVLGWYVKKFEK